MQRTSESISKIAGALAKAQAELENPRKSLTATIASPFRGEESRSFKYASLASGLEIVRKCLSKHEIAAVQATAIDPAVELLKITTTLIHSSGEWIASDWPVCAVSETGAPHRMGAALTYARRYSLFALVGIAGEDDLDAPDLDVAGGPLQQPSPPRANSSPPLVPANPPTARTAQRGRQPRGRPASPDRRNTAIFTAEASARLRQQLLSEIDEVTDSCSLTACAHRILPLKNQLSDPDAQAVEAAFEVKLGLADDSTVAVRSPEPRPSESEGEPIQLQADTETVVVLSKHVRERDRQHLKFVATQPCLVCGRAPSDAHHVKFAEPRALGRKVSDKYTVPVCRLHHRELHRRSNEVAWWRGYGIEPLGIASKLWRQTHAADVPDTGPDESHHTINGARSKTADAAPCGQNDETKPL